VVSSFYQGFARSPQRSESVAETISAPVALRKAKDSRYIPGVL